MVVAITSLTFFFFMIFIAIVIGKMRLESVWSGEERGGKHETLP